MPRTRYSREQVRELIRTLPARIAQKQPDPDGFADAFYAAYAHILFQIIHREYMVKSRGKPDSIGLQWAPLAPSTIARKQSKQNRYKKTKEKYIAQLTRDGMGVGDAKIKAAQLAHRSIGTVPIGIDTGELEKSLRPGPKTPPYKPSPGQVFEVTKGKVRMGTSVTHARRFHNRRRVWPTAPRMHPWTREALRAGRTALKEKLEQRL